MFPVEDQAGHDLADHLRELGDQDGRFRVGIASGTLFPEVTGLQEPDGIALGARKEKGRVPSPER